MGGAGGGLLFNVLYDMLKERISESMIYKPLLKNILSELDSSKPLIKQIEACNEELGIPEKEVEEFKLHMKAGIELVAKCSKVEKGIDIVEKYSKVEKGIEIVKQHMYKKYKYAKKLIGWDGALVTQSNILIVHEIRDVKKNLISAHSIEEGVSRIESSQTGQFKGWGGANCHHQWECGEASR